jgi:hypothetical protein
MLLCKSFWLIISSNIDFTPRSANDGYANPTMASKLLPSKIVTSFSTVPNY